MMLRLTLICVVLSAGGCGYTIRRAVDAYQQLSASHAFRQGRYGTLSEEEAQWATIAWQFFVNNTQNPTGIPGTVDQASTASMWNVADYMAALIAVHQMEMIEDKEFDERFSKILEFLNIQPLFFGKLPNKLYHVETGRMIDYDNVENELGWSAIDLGRLLIWLDIARTLYPHYSEYMEKAVMRWHFCDIINEDGQLIGGTKYWNQDAHQAEIVLFQEGRLGYEEYAALGYALWGFNTQKSSYIQPYAKQIIHGIEILYDDRDPRRSETASPVLSSPYMLYGLEFNWDQLHTQKGLDSLHSENIIAELAERVYHVQKKRYEIEHILTARSDYQLSSPPYFIYDTVFANGYEWNTISDDGTYHPDLGLVSTRAVFAMWALFHDEYTDTLIKAVQHLYDEERGFWEGRYEKTGYFEKNITSSTNAIILEALWHKTQGKLHKHRKKKGYLTAKLSDVYQHEQKCFPQERIYE